MTVRPVHLRLALVALAAAALYNVWHFALRDRPAQTTPASIQAQLAREAAEAPLIVTPSVGPAASGSASASAAPDPLTMPAPPRIDLSAPLPLARDPFLFGDESRQVESPAAAPIAAAPLPSVRSVLFSAERRLALVDGRIVGIGEPVGGYTVVEIERDAVVFGTPAGTRVRVSLHDPAVRVPAP